MILPVDRNCFRGPRPSDLRELRVDYGIDTIIDLESGVYEMVHDIVQFPPDFGMAYYHMPCSDFFAPNPDYVKKAIELMSNVDRRVYVHCLSGVDRTGFVCAAYRMQVQGWKYEEALHEWVVNGRHQWYFVWESALKKWSKQK